jgi:formamidopyrimidine-DNA glycosylase
MPELPEVETIKRQLQKSIARKTIQSADILHPRFIGMDAEKFKKIIAGAKIRKIRRRAKLLILELSNNFSIICHLKMTGKLIYHKQKMITNGHDKHAHIIYTFNDGSRLIHGDIRKFGYAKLMPAKDLNKMLSQGYGPEPLEPGFTEKKFAEIISARPKQKTKQFLLDQKNIAGIGNIYADEILFSAGILPDRKISSLSKIETKKLFNGIKKILSDAIKYRGSSISDYRDSSGRAGEYHLKLKVYGKEKSPCAKCKTAISKIKLSGRGTHFCSKCQK